MKKRSYPIESFGPEIMQALLKGAREEIFIELPSYRSGVYFLSRIHHLRKRMQEESHEAYGVVSKARCTLLWGERAGYEKVEEVTNSQNSPRPKSKDVPVKIRIAPHDAEFAAALKKAGVEVLKEEAAPTTAPSTSGLTSILDDYLPEGERE